MTDHRRMAETLRESVDRGPGVSDPSLRKAAVSRAAGGPLAAPYEALVQQISAAAYRVTDDQVAEVRTKLGSEKAAFEVVMAAAIGAGLLRWDRAMLAVDEASNASS